MHSISTSAPRGNSFTATQVLAWNMSCQSALVLNVPTVSGTYRHGYREVSCINTIHRSKVIHGGDENGHLENVLQPGFGCLEDQIQIAQ